MKSPTYFCAHPNTVQNPYLQPYRSHYTYPYPYPYLLQRHYSAAFCERLNDCLASFLLVHHDVAQLAAGYHLQGGDVLRVRDAHQAAYHAKHVLRVDGVVVPEQVLQA